jgi:hypothetical protein
MVCLYSSIRNNLKRVTRLERLRYINLKNSTFNKLNFRNPEVRKAFKRKGLKHLGKVGVACLSLAVTASFCPSATAIDNSTIAINNEVSKNALNVALKVTRSKSSVSVVTLITCVACIPVAGAAASPAMCIACGILIAKVIG